MPAKNAAAFLGEAIESALTQGSDVIEIIVVDDGSTDETRSIVQAFEDRGVRLLDNRGAGVSAARNTGARAANSDWLMFLDADDRLRPGAMAALSAGKSRAGCRCHLWRLRPHRRPGTPHRPAPFAAASGEAVRTGTGAARRRQFHRQWRRHDRTLAVLRRDRRLRRNAEILRGLALLVPARRAWRVPVYPGVSFGLSPARRQHDERGRPIAAGLFARGRAGFLRPVDPGPTAGRIGRGVTRRCGATSSDLRRNPGGAFPPVSPGVFLPLDGGTAVAVGGAPRNDGLGLAYVGI